MSLISRCFSVAVQAAAVLALSGPAIAQQTTCTPDWLPMFGTGPRDENINCSLVADIDGPGGDGEVLVLGARYNVLVYRNHVWECLGSNIGGDVLALTMYDPDGDGPQPASLIAAGNISVNSLTCGIARYDTAQQRWVPMTTGINGPWAVRTLAVFDPDGSGPLPPMLFAGGDFTIINGVNTPYLVKYDGTTWSAGGTFTNAVQALSVFDPDGDGPLPAQLYAAGNFTNVGVPAAHIAKFDGTSWSSLGTGINGTVYQLNVLDADGSGPAQPKLIASGSFSSAGGVSTANIAAWSGSGWSALGAGVNGQVSTTTVYDADGSGPLPPRLIVVGYFFISGSPYVPRMMAWDGVTWSEIDNGGILPDTMAGFDVDGTGRNSLVAAGRFETFGGINAYHVAAWDGASWRTLNSGIDDYIWCSAQFDPDGSGGAAPRLFVGGQFRTVAGAYSHSIAQWDGTAWRPVGNDAISGQLFAMCVYDDDGPGPHPPRLIVGGSFTIGGSVGATNIAAWDGTSWSPLGPGLSGLNGVSCLTTFDPDGDGPAQPLLIAGGGFSRSGASTVTNIAAWNGSTWSPLGDTLGPVYAVTSFDPDGPGGAPPQLIAGGGFDLANSARGVVRWDGSTWQPLGAGLPHNGSSGVLSFAVLDPDGTGPLPARLIAAGTFSVDQGAPNAAAAQWDGTTWSALGTLALGAVRRVSTFDPDGGGPAPRMLIVGDDTNSSAGTPIHGWDGTAWHNLSTPYYRSQILSLGTFDPDGDGPRPEVLVVGGNLMRTGQYAPTNIVAFGCSEAIDVPPPCSPADVGSAGGQTGGDNLLNNNDFIAFITLFFIEDARADLGSAGGLSTPDGQFDNNDFIAFINDFFTGCQ